MMDSEKRTLIKCSSLIFVLFTVLLSCSDKVQLEKPNVIFILADDLGYGDLSSYNPNSKIPTPQLDALAKGGMKFTDAHAPASICTPTRYGILTGQYAWRSPLKKGVLQSFDLELINDSIQTIAQVFQKGGYHTAHIGKWHLGYQWKVKKGYPSKWDINEIWSKDAIGERIDLSNGIKGGPSSAGFDYSFGFDGPNFPPYCFWENEKIIEEIPNSLKPDNLYGNKGLMQKGWDLQSVFPSLEKKTLDYLDTLSENNKPFFLYLALPAPHVPLLPSEGSKGASKAGLYGDFVVDVDKFVGRVVKKLKSTQLDKNTIIIFTSDNGSPGRTEDPRYGEGRTYFTGSGDIIEAFGHYPNGKFRGLKGDAWEGGHRVPMIVSWPEKISANTTNNQLICLTDWMSIAYEITEVNRPTNQAIDSKNILKTLFNPNEQVRQSIVHHSGSGNFAIRDGDWKLILAKTGDGYSEAHKPTKVNDAPYGQLYNLKSDPFEATNLYDLYPEKVNELKNLLARERTRISSSSNF